MRTFTPRIQQLAPLSDEHVVRHVLDGDIAAFELLMRRHNQRLFRLARSVLGNDSDAEDVVQDAYLRAYAALADFRGEASVLTWMTRITLHEALRVRRIRRRTPQPMPDENTQPPESTESSPVEALQNNEQRSALVAAFDALPTSYRMVAMLRLIEGQSTRETAEALRSSEANIKVRLHRAKQLLADTLRRRGMDELRDCFSFAGHRCDRIVRRVFAKIGDAPRFP